jgi:hypothetical protein
MKLLKFGKLPCGAGFLLNYVIIFVVTLVYVFVMNFVAWVTPDRPGPASERTPATQVSAFEDDR